MALRRPLPCESAGIAGRRRTPAVQPRRPPRLPGPQPTNCPQMMTTDPTGSTAGDIPRGRVRLLPAGDSPRVRGQESRPRRRRRPPAAQDCPRPQGNVPGRAERTRQHRMPAPARAAHPPTHRTPPPAPTRRAGRSRPLDQPQPAPRTDLNRPSAAAFRRQNAATTAPSGQVLLM